MKISTGIIILAPFTLTWATASTCPTNQKPCRDFGNGRLGYSVNKVNKTDGTCHQVCTTGPQKYLDDGYVCGDCKYASCPNQPEPCSDFGNGFLGYSIHQIDSTTGECKEMCTTGNALALKLHKGEYKCGKCPKPSCPQEPCRDLGNGWSAYWVHKIDEKEGHCISRCSGGNSLATALHSQDFKCGKCPAGSGGNGPSCPNQSPCKDYGNGLLGYSVSKVATDGTCKEYCAAGTSLTRLQKNDGYECGKCTPPSCPKQSPCKDFGNGLLGYSVRKMATDGTCKEYCAAGTRLTSLQLNDGYECGKCSPPRLPSCPNQGPCKDFGNGLLGYSVSKLASDGTCKEYCAAGTSLTSLQNKDGYKCGKCTPPSCPNQSPCKDFGNGLLGYSIHKIENSGQCQTVCAAGSALSRSLHSGEYKCGKCPSSL